MKCPNCNHEVTGNELSFSVTLNGGEKAVRTMHDIYILLDTLKELLNSLDINLDSDHSKPDN